MEKSISAQHLDPYVISLIELDFHYESLDALIKIFQHHVSKVHVFTTAENIELLSEIDYAENVVFHRYKPFSKMLFLLKNRKILKSSDFTFINTIATNFGAYLAVPNPRTTILRIHNINKQFIPFQSVKYPHDALSTWKFCSYVGREIILKLFPLFRAMINKRIRHFTFPDNGLKNYVLRNGYLPNEKAIDSLPLKVFSGLESPSKITDELIITIMGATDPSRRDYREIISALQEIYKHKSPKIKLVLLGKVKGSYGEWVLEELDKINSSDFTLQYFNKNVPEGDFVKIASQSHLVLSPIIAESKTDIFREVYGKTKTSGSILDFIKFGIVTMTPSFYDAPEELEVFFQKYEDAGDLAKKILYFYENTEILNELNSKSRDFVSERYNTDKIYASCIQSFKLF